MSGPSAHTREVVRAAARWLALVESGQASPGDLDRLAQWRASDLLHEQAWQKAQVLRQRFAQLPNAVAMATLDRGQASRRALLKQALAIAAVAPSAWLLSQQVPLQAWTADVHTAVGERRQWTLADGTHVQLNTDSAVDIDLAARQVKLIRGELAISMAQGLAMTVQVPEGHVSLRGAEVCLRLRDSTCQVSVIRGAATLQPLRGSARELAGGQQASLGAMAAGPVSATDDLLLGWRDGVLRVNDRPLDDLLRELRRYRPGILRWPPELARLRVTGTFRLDDTDRVLDLLAASLPLQVQRRTRYWVTLVVRDNHA